MAHVISMREMCKSPLIAANYFCWLAIYWEHDPCSWSREWAPLLGIHVPHTTVIKLNENILITKFLV